MTLLATAWAWQLAEQQVSSRRRERFAHEVHSATEAITGRLRQYESALRGAQGLFAASKSVDREEWMAFVSGLSMDKRFPGASGLAFIAHVPHEQLDSFLAAVRADGNPSFALSPPGPRPAYCVITYHEPQARNHLAFGYDVGTIPAERAALEQARDTDQPTLTQKMRLVQDTQGQPGAVLLLPIYRSGWPRATVEQRRAALAGWVAAPLRLGPLLSSVLGESAGYIDFCIYDQRQDADHLLYASSATAPENSSGGPAASFSQDSSLQFGGRTWIVHCDTNAAFHALSDDSQPGVVLLGGLVFSTLLSALVWSLSTTSRRAQALAGQMTRTLRESEAESRKLALIASRTDNSVVLTDCQGCIEWVNDGFARISGYTLEEVRGRLPTEFLRGADTDPVIIARIEEGVRLGQSFQIEFAARAKDGRLYWATAHVQPMLDENGRTGRFMAIGIDITDRKQAEKLESDRRQVLEMIARNEPLEATLKHLADLIHSQTPALLPAILVLRDGQMVQVAAGLPAPFREAVDQKAIALASALCRLPGATEGKLPSPIWPPTRPGSRWRAPPPSTPCVAAGRCPSSAAMGEPPESSRSMAVSTAPRMGPSWPCWRWPVVPRASRSIIAS